MPARRLTRTTTPESTHRPVRITLDLVVDPETWTATYGQDPLDDNADDVATYVLGLVQQSAAAAEGCIVRAVLR